MIESRRAIRVTGLIGAIAAIGVLLAIYGPARPPATPSTPEGSRFVNTTVPPGRVANEPIAPRKTASSLAAGPAVASAPRPTQARAEASTATAQTSVAPPLDSALRTAALSSLHQTWVRRSPDEPTLRAWVARHEELEQEPRDPLWGEPTETSLLSYFSERPASIGVEVLGASCRTSACEIQAADAQPSEHGARDGQAFLNGLLYQPWARADIEDLQLFMTQVDGRTVYWAYLIRRQPEGAKAAAPPYPPTR